MSSTARRFSMADLTKYGNHLIEKLKDSFPHVHEKMLAGWLNGLNQSNQNLFIINDYAVALCRVYQEELCPDSVVKEIFVYALPDASLEDASTIYVDIQNWAKRLGAGYMILETHTDIPRAMIEKICGKINREAYSCVKVKK